MQGGRCILHREVMVVGGCIGCREFIGRMYAWCTVMDSRDMLDVGSHGRLRYRMWEGHGKWGYWT